MNKPKDMSKTAPSVDISEAERMAKIRELLVGPVIADESARVDQSVDRLDRLASEQSNTLAGLQKQIDELQDLRRKDMQKVETRLLGLVEALLADEAEIRDRLARNERLQSSLKIAEEDGAR